MTDNKVPMVVTRLAEVMTKLPGLEKNKTAPKQAGGYAYRGIDDLLDTLHPLLVESKLNIKPDIDVDKSFVVFNAESKVPSLAVVFVSYEFQSTEDGSTKIIGPVMGTGTDNLDKMSGKAMTSALKNAMYQAFCIPVGDPSLDTGGGSIDIEAEDGPSDEGTARDNYQPTDSSFTKPPAAKTPEASKDDRHRHELHSLASELAQNDQDIYTAYIREWTTYTDKNKKVWYCTKASDTYPSSGDFILQGTRLNIALEKARKAQQTAQEA